MGSAQRLTDATRIAVLTAARLGLSQRKTAALAKVPQQTLSDWLRDNDDLREEYEQAQAEPLREIALNLLTEAASDAELGLKVLERHDPEAWMRREGRELTGRDGEPLDTGESRPRVTIVFQSNGRGPGENVSQ